MGKRKKIALSITFFPSELDELNAFCLKHDIARNDFIRQAVMTCLGLGALMEVQDLEMRNQLTREEIKKLWNELPKLSKPGKTSDLKMTDERAEEILNTLEQIKAVLRKQRRL